jgi:hypothetical protein
MRRWVAGVSLCWAVIALGGCGGGSADQADVDATTASVATGPLLDGVYVLTGTQQCKSAQGGGSVSLPIFEGSTLKISGDYSTVDLRHDSLEAPVTTDGNSFHINQTFDLSGDPVVTTAGEPPTGTELVLDLTGTISDGGQTITGTGYDMGVNCQYTFTGRWTDGAAPTPPTVADPCAVGDPAGKVYDYWSHFDPSLGEVRVVSSCAEPWARANFEHGNDTLLHWNGSIWELADPVQYCASTTRPAGTPSEDNPAARIYDSTCSPAAQPTTTTTTTTSTSAPTPNPSAGPCTKAAVQAALDPDELALNEPRCDGPWALTDVKFAEDAETTYMFHWNGSAWEVANQPSVCARDDIPPLIKQLCDFPVG